jgi:hypothetical protein
VRSMARPVRPRQYAEESPAGRRREPPVGPGCPHSPGPSGLRLLDRQARQAWTRRHAEHASASSQRRCSSWSGDRSRRAPSATRAPLPSLERRITPARLVSICSARTPDARPRPPA